MPYITKEEVARKRKLIKSEFPDFKFSFKMDNYSTIDVTVMSGPIDMKNKCKGYQVNPYGIEQHFKDEKEIKDFLLKVYEIANEGNGDEYESADYGMYPKFYVHITIGTWDKNYELK